MKLFIAFLLSVFAANFAVGQISDIVKSDEITNALHRANIGRITFMAKAIPLEEYQETDFLQNFEISETCDLNIRVFMGNSLTNYLHRLAPELTADELTKNGNYQFSFYVDDKLIYTENLHAGAGTAANKNARTVFRVPFISTTNEDSWGRFLWNRFLWSGGEDALEDGIHRLKIEIRPYLKTSEIKVGELIAQGELQVSFFKPKVNEQQIAVQKIEPKSGWQISKANFDTEKIKQLNRKIAENSFKEITGIVVIKDGKILIEEYFNGANQNTLHDTRSVGKTFASAIAGIALKDGYLKSVNQTLSDFYKLKDFENYAEKKKNVTIKHLLAMSSGFEGFDEDESSVGNEENMYPQSDWVKWTLNLPMAKRNAGEEWAYFTAGVVLLGDILQKSVPDGLEKYANKKLFKPLEIKNYKWQYTPQKVANTAGSLQMSALDFAKFGQLYKNGGKWNGKQIIPESWVKESLRKQISLPDNRGFYGYLWWNKTFSVDGKDYEVSYCSGNGGNKIFVFKDLPFVIIITATAYNKPYMHRQIDRMLEKYLIPAITYK